MINKKYKSPIVIVILISCALCACSMANLKIDKNSLQIIINSSTKTPLWNCTWDASEGRDIGMGVALDSSDNIYVVGTTYTVLTPGYNDDALLIKYNTAGTQIWNVTYDLYEFDYGSDIAVDSSDNIYIVGSTHRQYGPINASLFCVKFDANGELLWNVTEGGNPYAEGYAEAFGVAVDSLDNVYVVGKIKSNIYFIKYSSTGTKLWETNWGGIRGFGVVVDASDNLYITGITDIDPTPDYNLQAFLARFNTAGQQIWNTTWGYQDFDCGYEVKTDSLGNIYVVGESNFTETGENCKLTLTKFNSRGTQLWSSSWGNGGEDFGAGLCIDDSNNIYVTGGTDFNLSLSISNYHACLLKYDSNGNKIWETIWNESSVGHGVDTDSLDNVYVVGMVSLDDKPPYNSAVFLAMFPKDESVPEDSLLILIIILSLIGCVSVIGITIIIKRKR